MSSVITKEFEITSSSIAVSKEKVTNVLNNFGAELVKYTPHMKANHAYITVSFPSQQKLDSFLTADDIDVGSILYTELNANHEKPQSAAS
mmetsp:Transcript_735/g.991  ORF Transcript_735/g.991 Transcript_735/m.991 type:complete len:90 (+) Transcript_735:23-292(+)